MTVGGRTVITVNMLANGGQNSPIGASSNASSNLTLVDSFLRYIGPAVTIDRGYSVQNNGGFDASGTGALVITGAMAATHNAFNNATFRLAGTNTDANTLTANINNGGSDRRIGIAKSGTGTWRLTGANGYTLGTTISGGTLLIDNTTGSGTGTVTVTVSAATLGGTGAASGAVTIGNNTGADDAFLSPGTIGTPIESLGTGVLTFNSDGVLVAQINSSLLTADLVSVTGTVALGEGIATLQLSDLGSATLSNGASFTLINSTGAVSGYFEGLAPVSGVGPQVVVGSNTYQLNYNATSVTLTVVPEPTALALVGLSLIPALRRRSR
jgi:fibronectin-binding autotransporter adhesin